MIKEWILKEENTVWSKPLLYSIFSLILVIFIQIIDRGIIPLESYLPSIFLVEKPLVETVLSTLSGALLTMTTITFSTIMVVLTTYSTQFSPRTLKNYLTKPTATRVLGVFMGGFVYSTVSLLMLDVSEENSGVVLSATVGVLVALVCLGYFAYFIHNVATFIRVSNLIEELTSDALASSVKEKQEIEDINGELIHGSFTLFSKEGMPTATIYAKKDGYVQLINYKGLVEFAEKNDCLCMFTIPIGTYVTTSTAIATIVGTKTVEMNSEEYITIGAERTTLQDREYGIQKLVEVALKAISPGINDPNTAIDCIKHLKEPLKEAILISGVYLLLPNENGEQKVLIPRRTAEDILYAAFYQLAHYGRQDVSVLRAILETLHFVEHHSNIEGKEAAQKMKDYCSGKFDKGSLHPLDNQKLSDLLE
ncbi:DUF2254 domain-containing protein [Mangrovibacillus cuniculi]|uniref:DUF2254 domain-containing protein n=1 Tax=Mangrovibacillus cuniculi TaxID=2593652 RepID=A0A7S8CD71_9BACI|nr:DUF2254 domain-containing protein [Mangrovibacillus cuniculi]QPC47814.1 DUF2254 domain-containing protein [Mangrovibacillus cuniculi]